MTDPKPISATIRDLAYSGEVLICNDAEMNALMCQHEGEVLEGRRLVFLGLSDDGRDQLWQFIRTDVGWSK